MAYLPKYIIYFTGETGREYTVFLLRKDYTGSATQLVGGPDPFVLNYQSGDDEIINAIRASEATIQFYSPPGITEFYSEDDDAWQVLFYDSTAGEDIWWGYVVQDACTEPLQDAPYLVTLRATDNVGLLKDIPFDFGFKRAGFYTTYFTDTTNVDALTPGQLVITVLADDKDTALMNYILYGGIVYIIEKANYPSTTALILDIDPSAPSGIGSATYTIYTANDPLTQLQLYTFIQTAIQNTGLLLRLNIYSNLYENTEDDRSITSTADMFTDERLHANMFMNDSGEWQSIYEVLEIILMPLNATFMQAGGKWVVVRQSELKLFANAIPGTAYDPAIPGAFAVTLATDYAIAIGSDNLFINADAQRSILRPLKSVKHTFNYELPELIKNLNFNILGELLNEYTFDPGGPNEELRREYALPFWTELDPGGPDMPFVYIRQVYEIPAGGTDEVETDRYILLQSGLYGGPWLESSAFYINVNDRVNVSFSLRTETQNTGSGSLFFKFETDDGINEYAINMGTAAPDGTWTTTGGAEFAWATSPDTREWATFSVSSLGVPVAGYFSIKLMQVDNTPGGETHYKDFNVDYFGYVAGSLRMTGQYHLQQSIPKPKNIRDVAVLIDDSPKQVFKGALLTSLATAGGYITLTTFWHRGAITEARRLGEIATLERAVMQAKPRAVIEGTIYFTDLPTPLNVFQIDMLPDLNFIAGVMEVNYFTAMCNLKLWEIYEDGETDGNPAYRFEYIKEL